MVVEKQYIGSAQIERFDKINYYVLKGLDCYGIEVEQIDQGSIFCGIEYFTEDYSLAKEAAELFCKHEVTVTHLPEVLDDFISEKQLH